jgi:hypothetical protein
MTKAKTHRLLITKFLLLGSIACAHAQATGIGVLCAIETSIRRSSVTICSAPNLFFGMTQAPFQAHSLTTLGLKKPSQVTAPPQAC